MLKTYRIIPLVFILFLFGFTLITVSPVFAEEEKPTEETCKNLPVGHDMDACYSYFFGHTSCWKTCGPGEGIPLPSEMTQSAEEIACGKLQGRAQRICFEEIPCTTLIPNPFPGDIEACEKRKVEDKARGLERKRQAEQAAKEREEYPVGSRAEDEKLAAEALANAKEEYGDEAEAAKARVKAEEDRMAEAAAKAEEDRLVAQQRREAAEKAEHERQVEALAAVEAEQAAQAAELVQLAQDNNCVLQVGHVERFNPVFDYLQEAASDPRFIETHRLSPYPKRSIDIGVVLDLMIHDLDAVMAFVNSPITEIDGVGVPVLSESEDIANARSGCPSCSSCCDFTPYQCGCCGNF